MLFLCRGLILIPCSPWVLAWMKIHVKLKIGFQHVNVIPVFFAVVMVVNGWCIDRYHYKLNGEPQPRRFINVAVMNNAVVEHHAFRLFTFIGVRCRLTISFFRWRISRYHGPAVLAKFFMAAVNHLKGCRCPRCCQPMVPKPIPKNIFPRQQRPSSGA